MKVEVLACPYDEKDVADEDHPAWGYAEHIISEDGNTRYSEVRESVVKGKVVDREGLHGAGDDDYCYGFPFSADERESERKKSADKILHDSSL